MTSQVISTKRSLDKLLDEALNIFERLGVNCKLVKMGPQIGCMSTSQGASTFASDSHTLWFFPCLLCRDPPPPSRTWDPKITTLPGLYVFSVIYLKIAGLFMGQDFCDIHGLRVFNVFLCLANFILIYRLQRQISTLGRWCDGRKCLADECKWRDLATALNMSLFPVLYYFAFFYYTEQLSTFTVLLTYSLSLTEYTKESAIMAPAPFQIDCKILPDSPVLLTEHHQKLQA
ncbi:putative Dol-P-Glc:Glc(2)Man(9)GlcNAc(2)-PP-Dol alpha-1,2-glucosyltransferase [Schistocerca americana]|uniref:putative Dol-P-Glc:Glc(2)Man(9)GlcNAc(2)-PP-Dol alpha-1,2-glucosyltransferase n=1 Tax=Schistocerca americana TaxID=7009 RepID=UPI001F4F2B25|nr:putative Dol-P-Glc:Glc(2)Man(9)GlcNAc(2)-PP-Dol alpha-1,2-glucosyltransferase [Schistocerca americana]